MLSLTINYYNSVVIVKWTQLKYQMFALDVVHDNVNKVNVFILKHYKYQEKVQQLLIFKVQ